MSPTTPILFLHGLGDTPQAWEEVARKLGDVDTLTPFLFGASESTSWTLEETTDRIANSVKEPVHGGGS